MQSPLVVIPTYNEAGNIARLLSALLAAGLSIVVVDDNSPDGTAQIVSDIAISSGGRVHLLSRPAKTGLGRAYVEGFLWALDRGYDPVIQMDADFQHSPADVPALLEALRDGADMVIGSRYVRGASIPSSFRLTRRLLSRWANLYAQFALGLPVRDATGGFKAHRSALLRKLDLLSTRSHGYGFQIETTQRACLLGARVVEVPIAFGERTADPSKMSAHIVIEALTLVTRMGLGRARDALRAAILPES